jgi:hypothetical protein
VNATRFRERNLGFRFRERPKELEREEKLWWWLGLEEVAARLTEGLIGEGRRWRWWW